MGESKDAENMREMKEDFYKKYRERAKQIFQIGDKVRCFNAEGYLFNGKVCTIVERGYLGLDQLKDWQGDETDYYYGVYVEGETNKRWDATGKYVRYETSVFSGLSNTNMELVEE